MMKLAINGFGRIGRSLYRLLATDPEIQLVAINDIAGSEPLAYLLRYDTVMGRFEHAVHLDGENLVAGDQRSRLTRCRRPRCLPWEEHEVERSNIMRIQAVRSRMGLMHLQVKIPVKYFQDAPFLPSCLSKARGRCLPLLPSFGERAAPDFLH